MLSGNTAWGAVRRIVTGVDQQGRSIIEVDEPSPFVKYLNPSKTLVWVDLWRTTASASKTQDPDACRTPMELLPPVAGTVVRMMQFPPEQDLLDFVPADALSAEDPAARTAFAEDGSAHHPMMHKTNSIDYAIVLQGEIWAIMEAGETCMRAGDVLIQRGTSHAWANRSTEPCIIAFVLVDGRVA